MNRRRYAHGPGLFLLASCMLLTGAESAWGQSGACCAGDGSCAVTEEVACIDVWLGDGTDCAPNCCPQAPTGSDCACETKVCRDDGTMELTAVLCEENEECGADYSCVVACTPTGVTTLQYDPYTCHDLLGSEVIPFEPCDPGNGDADCTSLDPNWTCERSFAVSVSTSLTGTVIRAFGVAQGDHCTLDEAQDDVGWYELFELTDVTPGDPADDCFKLTVSLCCNDPVRSPVWSFLSELRNCPCHPGDTIERIGPDFDGTMTADGFPPDCNAAHCCADGNYAATFTLPPGQYAYQVRSSGMCVGSTTMCDTDEDCPGTACEIENPDYALQFTVDSCAMGACCLADNCILTNRLDCDAQLGYFLGDGVNPVVRCPPDIPNPCMTGACCIDGNCRDDMDADTASECEAEGGGYFAGGAICADDPCPVCPIDVPANCQQVQTVFGPNPRADRNPDNGFGGPAIGTTDVVADDIHFDGSVVDDICWNVGMYATSDQSPCAQSVPFDNTWEIRMYESDGTGGIPGTEICFSTITVLNKLEGTGQATSTWQYSGRLDTPCNLPNGGVGGDKYWVEVSGFGDSGCAVHSIWSRDEGNKHAAWQSIDVFDGRLGYTSDQVLNLDIGFCEDDGITAPNPVLGSCCTCTVTTCMANITQSECLDDLNGEWILGGTCAPGECVAIPPNDDCASAEPVEGIPAPVACTTSADCNGGVCNTSLGTCFGDGFGLVIATNNICATDDGPPLTPGLGIGCGQSIFGDGECHDDIWFSYVSEHCGTLRITSCPQWGGDTDYDQIIAIYDGNSSCPLATSDELACNDDGCTGGFSLPSNVSLEVVEGQELLVRVGGWNNEVPGGFIGAPHGYMELHWSFTETCTTCVGLLPAPPPHDFLKNRYISLAQAVGVDQFDISVTLAATLVNDVTAVGLQWWANPPDAKCISIVGPTRPAKPPDWSACPVVHLTGCPIIPTSTYLLEAFGASRGTLGPCEFRTQAMPMGSKWWGDCVGSFDPGCPCWTPPQGIVGIDDALAVIRTFQNPNAVNAVHVSVADLHPFRPSFPPPANQINKLVNIDDAFATLQGFQGSPYPGPEIELCTDP